MVEKNKPVISISEGNLNGEGLRIGVIVSRFNNFITERLLEGCLDALERHGVKPQNIHVVRVPGGFELPLAAKALAKSKKFDALVCLGSIMRGDTTHNEYIASEVTKGIAQVSLENEIPVAYGVITPDTLEQAIERAGTKAGNKGWDAALSAIEMANLLRTIKP